MSLKSPQNKVLPWFCRLHFLSPLAPPILYVFFRIINVFLRIFAISHVWYGFQKSVGQLLVLTTRLCRFGLWRLFSCEFFWAGGQNYNCHAAQAPRAHTHTHTSWQTYFSTKSTPTAQQKTHVLHNNVCAVRFWRVVYADSNTHKSNHQFDIGEWLGHSVILSVTTFFGGSVRSFYVYLCVKNWKSWYIIEITLYIKFQNFFDT